MTNPFKSILNKNPTKKELADWSPQRWLEFLQFVDFHLVVSSKAKGKPEEDHYDITDARILEIEKILEQPNHPWKEFLYRINKFSFEGGHHNGYYKRIANLATQVLGYLKLHPSIITSEMKVILEKNKARMSWALRQYYIKDTPQGEVVLRDTMVPNGTIKMESLQKKQLDTLVTMVDLLKRMVDEAKKRNLSELEVKEIYNAMPKLVDAINKLQNRQLNINHLTQINIHGGAREMEVAALEFVKQKQN